MDTVNAALIEKYLKGIASPEETQFVQSWLLNEGSDLNILRGYMEDQWDGKADLINSETDQRMLSLLKQRLYPEKEVPSIKARWKYIAAACLVPLVLVTGWYLYSTLNNKISKQEVASWLEYSNNSQEIEQQTLPDSTKVWLHPHSRLSYSTNFVKSKRSVRITGEAFFDVAVNAQYPFVVHAGNISTTVLGTAFNLESYEKENQVRVSLVSGKVSVQNDSAKNVTSHLLSPGTLLRWEKKTDSVHKEHLSNLSMADFTNGYIVFNDVLLSNALNRIAQRYQLQLHYAPGVHLETRRITTILKENPLDELTHLLPFITPYQCSVQNQTLYITNKK